MQPCANIKFKLLHEGALLPKRGTPMSGGFDIFAPEPGCIFPGERKLIGTGLAHEIPEDIDIDLVEDAEVPHKLRLLFHGFLVSRSGIATKHGVKLFFDPCLIDHDYRGEIKVLLHNGGTEEYRWERGERLCQIVYLPCYAGGVELSAVLGDTERGTGGFGSTGK